MDGKHISHETIYRMIRKDKAEGGTLYSPPLKTIF